jgi:hypothetical protein
MIGLFTALCLVMVAGIAAGNSSSTGHFFRLAYLVSFFIVVGGGVALAKIDLHFPSRTATVLTIMLLLSAVAGTGITSAQMNQVDPQLYTGETQSPKFQTESQVKILNEFYGHAVEDSLVVGDSALFTVAPAPQGRPTVRSPAIARNSRRVTVRQFVNPELRLLDEEYRYLALDRRTLERGFIYGGTTGGLGRNETRLQNHRVSAAKIWVGGDTQIYHRVPTNSTENTAG